MKRTLLFLGMFLSMLSVCAEDNVLQSIEIVPVKRLIDAIGACISPVEK